MQHWVNNCTYWCLPTPWGVSQKEILAPLAPHLKTTAQPTHRIGTRRQPSLQHPGWKEEKCCAQRGRQGVLGAAPGCWHDAQPTAPSRAQLHSSVNFPVLTALTSRNLKVIWAAVHSWHYIKHQLKREKNRAVRSPSFPKRQKLSCACEKGGVPAPVGQEKSHVPNSASHKTLLGLRGPPPASQQGVHFSALLHKEEYNSCKAHSRGQPRRSKLPLFLNRLIPRTWPQRDLQLASNRRKDRI